MLCSPAIGAPTAHSSMPFAPREFIAGRHARLASLAASKWSFSRLRKRLNNKGFALVNAAGRGL